MGKRRNEYWLPKKGHPPLSKLKLATLEKSRIPEMPPLIPYDGAQRKFICGDFKGIEYDFVIYDEIHVINGHDAADKFRNALKDMHAAYDV